MMPDIHASYSIRFKAVLAFITVITNPRPQVVIIHGPQDPTGIDICVKRCDRVIDVIDRYSCDR